MNNLVAIPPRNKRVDQVLTSYLFDMYTTSDNKIKEGIERYNYLYDEKRNEQEEQELKELVVYLNETLGSAETELEKNVADILEETLKSLFKENVKKMDKETHPAKFELIRQLKKLID